MLCDRLCNTKVTLSYFMQDCNKILSLDHTLILIFTSWRITWRILVKISSTQYPRESLKYVLKYMLYM